MQGAEQRIIRCQGDWSHSLCPLRASGTKPTLWSAAGCDIYSHFYRLWVASHPNATWEFLGVISSWFMKTSCDIALRQMPQKISDGESTLVQVMVWCHQVTSHNLSKC